MPSLHVSPVMTFNLRALDQERAMVATLFLWTAPLSYFYQEVQHLGDTLLIKTGPETKYPSFFSRQAAPYPNLPHLLIDSNHLDSSAEVTCVLICITATWKYAENLARPDFRSPKAKPWSQNFGILQRALHVGNRERESVIGQLLSEEANQKHKLLDRAANGGERWGGRVRGGS